jgi:hypothetical protein
VKWELSFVSERISTWPMFLVARLVSPTVDPSGAVTLMGAELVGTTWYSPSSRSGVERTVINRSVGNMAVSLNIGSVSEECPLKCVGLPSDGQRQAQVPSKSPRSTYLLVFLQIGSRKAWVWPGDNR